MDGVLIDTEPLYDQFHDLLLQQYELRAESDFLRSQRGVSGRDFVTAMREVSHLCVSLEQLLAEYRVHLMNFWESQTHLKSNPGVRELITALKEAKLPQAVASSGNVKRIALLLKRTELLQEFDDIIHGESVAHGKPAPDMYLLAAERLGVDPQSCVAIEDAANGVRSAKAAGMKVVGYKPAHSDQDVSAADLIVDDLRALSLARLKQL